MNLSTKSYCQESEVRKREKQISYIKAYMWNLEKKTGIDDLIHKAEIETQMQEQMYGYQEGKGGGE